MNRCFALAKKGAGLVSPNPMVGCVIVYNNDIIGEGWHQKYGKSHAEVNAIQSVATENKKLLKKSTLYVNLEPCNHTGKTPPCANAIIENGIPHVVISNVDSNPKVEGSGIEKLMKYGVKVESGVLANEGKELNRRFFTSIENNRPYIILKWAQSADGFMAKNDGKQTWITSEKSRRIVHQWRSEEDAILIGNNTLKIDDPKLNNRYFKAANQPTRIVISKDLKEKDDSHFFDSTQPSIVVNSSVERGEKNMQFWQFKFNNSLIFNLLNRLNKQSIQSIIIEGGAHTLEQFININLWDEARILTGNTLLNDGISSPTFKGELVYKNSFGGDSITTYKNR